MVNPLPYEDPALRVRAEQVLPWWTSSVAVAYVGPDQALVLGQSTPGCALELAAALPPTEAQQVGLGFWWTGAPAADLLPRVAELAATPACQGALVVQSTAARAEQAAYLLRAEQATLQGSMAFKQPVVSTVDPPASAAPHVVSVPLRLTEAQRGRLQLPEAMEGTVRWWDAARGVERFEAQEAARAVLGQAVPAGLQWATGAEDATLYAALRDPDRLDAIAEDRAAAVLALEAANAVLARAEAGAVLRVVSADDLTAVRGWAVEIATAVGQVVASLDALRASVDALPEQAAGPPQTFRFQKIVQGEAPAWWSRVRDVRAPEAMTSQAEVEAVRARVASVAAVPDALVLAASLQGQRPSAGSLTATRALHDHLDAKEAVLSRALTPVEAAVGPFGTMVGLTLGQDGKLYATGVVVGRSWLRADASQSGGAVRWRSQVGDAVLDDAPTSPLPGHQAVRVEHGGVVLQRLAETSPSSEVVWLPMAVLQGGDGLAALLSKPPQPGHVVYGSASIRLRGRWLELELGGHRALTPWVTSYPGRADKSWADFPRRIAMKWWWSAGALPDAFAVARIGDRYLYEAVMDGQRIDVCEVVTCDKE